MFNYYEISLWEYLLLQLPSLLEFWMTKKNKTATETNTHRSSHLMKKPGCLKEDNPFLPFKGNHRDDSGDDLQPHRGGCLLLSQFLCSKKQLLEESGVWFETRIGGWKKKPVAFFGKSVLWILQSQFLQDVLQSFYSRVFGHILFKLSPFCQLLLYMFRFWYDTICMLRYVKPYLRKKNPFVLNIQVGLWHSQVAVEWTHQPSTYERWLVLPTALLVDFSTTFCCWAETWNVWWWFQKIF